MPSFDNKFYFARILERRDIADDQGLPESLRLDKLRKKVLQNFVILSEAKNLSFFSKEQIEERFFASLRMTK
jgi:hypothetical protein